MIPAELRALPQWIAWRYETRATRHGPKPTKVPLDPKRPSRRASSTDPATWGTYRQALACLDSEGIGFVFSESDPYLGVDMDACVNTSGALHPDAWQIVRALDGYVEFSPSGSGLHLIVRGRIARGRHTLKTPWGNELAVYACGRFFTMSGDGRGDIRDAQDALDTLMARFFPPVQSPPHEAPATGPPAAVSDDDQALLDRMFGAVNGERTQGLWEGDLSAHGDDHSAADLALCRHLAYWTGGDVDRIDSLFRRSGLMRDKWLEARGDSTYGAQTIRRALEG